MSKVQLLRSIVVPLNSSLQTSCRLPGGTVLVTGGLVTGGLVTGGLVTGGLVTGGLVTGGLVTGAGGGAVVVDDAAVVVGDVDVTNELDVDVTVELGGVTVLRRVVTVGKAVVLAVDLPTVGSPVVVGTDTASWPASLEHATIATSDTVHTAMVRTGRRARRTV